MDNNKVIYEFNGGIGDTLTIYPDKMIIGKGSINLFSKSIKGYKTIYIKNLTSIQLKKAGWTPGYIQIAIPGEKISFGGIFNATQDENTIAYCKKGDNNEVATKIVNYLDERIVEIKNESKNKNPSTSISIAEELIKLKKLLDMEGISKEEFEETKQRLLNKY